jgi:photosystem II stability/assembly factor-like uncharacterized protein
MYIHGCCAAGAPLVITALAGEPGQAELTTDQGAIYVTNNKAYTWSAAVLETVDATLNRTVSSGEQQRRCLVYDVICEILCVNVVFGLQC